jgi:signal peptidase II
VRKNTLIVIFIVLSILILDQAVKIYIKTNYSPFETHDLIGEWFRIQYIENQGMAFGTTLLGGAFWGKLALSVFRIVAIFGIGYYWIKQAKKGLSFEFLIAVGLILAGATGNLIDSMFYDFIFPFEPCVSFNHLEGSGIYSDCGFLGTYETRNTGFLFGNVVDMFEFHAYWPDWMPWLGGKEIFPAVWNVADASITMGVVMVFVRHNSYVDSYMSRLKRIRKVRRYKRLKRRKLLNK